MNRVPTDGLEHLVQTQGHSSLPKLMRRNNHLDIRLIRNCIWECWTKSGSGAAVAGAVICAIAPRRANPSCLRCQQQLRAYQLSFRLIVRRFFRDQHIVDVRLAQARR